METYIITEKQNMASAREGNKIEAANLAAAKRAATKMQVFRGTVLTIETENGILLASKSGAKWTDHE